MRRACRRAVEVVARALATARSQRRRIVRAGSSARGVRCRAAMIQRPALHLKYSRAAALGCSIALFAACGAENDPSSELEFIESELTVTATLAPPHQPIPGIPIGQPDLIVGGFAVTAPPVLHCGPQSLSFTAVESNIGNAAAGRHLLYLQRLNPFNGQFQNSASTALAGLSAGTTRNIAGTYNFFNGPCDCLPSTYTITFRIFDDGALQVDESNEGNNASNSIVVAAACP